MLIKKYDIKLCAFWIWTKAARVLFEQQEEEESWIEHKLNRLIKCPWQVDNHCELNSPPLYT